MSLPTFFSDFSPIDGVLSVGSPWLSRRVSPEQHNAGPNLSIDYII